MNFPIKIAFWEAKDDHSPITEFLDSIAVRDAVWISKKNSYFERKNYKQLEYSKHWGKIVNIDYELYELKYHSSPPYRAICIPWKEKIVILVLFKGSGSNGNVNRYLPTAVERAKDWKERFI